MPRSSFDCFHGTLQTDRLALKVRNSYEKVDYPYSVALQAQTVSASAANPAAAPIGLEGYSQIKQLSSGDKQILSTCKAALK
jgi:ABC-type molybdate transport system substrate-binding protein